MENEIRKLIEKWNKIYLELDVDGEYKDPDEYINTFILDMKDLLEFKKKICCGKVGI